MKRSAIAFLSVFCFLLPVLSFANVTVVGGLTRETVIKPGAEGEGRIILRNPADESVQVRLYQQDYTFQADGTTEFSEPGSLGRSNAPWLTITPRELELPAGGTGSVFYSFKVPEKEDLVGTYWSVIMVEPVAKKLLKPSELSEDKPGIGIRITTRQAVQMVMHNGDTGSRQLRFAKRRLLEKDGKRFLQLDIENTGQRWLRPKVWTEVYDEEGRSIGRFEVGRRRIFPDCSVRFQVDLSALPAGSYSSVVVADAGAQAVFGARYEFELPEKGDVVPQKDSGNTKSTEEKKGAKDTENTGEEK